MKAKLNVRLVRHWFVSTGIFLSLPLGLATVYFSASAYIEAGDHLTPYSVHVRGYYRSNGTYVRPHSRRSPGSVARDAPYQSRRAFAAVCFFGGLGALAYSANAFRRLNADRQIADIQSSILNDMKRTFVSRVPKSPRGFSVFYYMDNYKQYSEDEMAFSDIFAKRFHEETGQEPVDITVAKRAFRELVR